MTNLVTRLYRRLRPDTKFLDEDAIQKYRIVDRAEEGMFFSLLTDTMDKLLADHLLASKGSEWDAGFAAGILTLTKELRGYKSEGIRILKARMENEEREKQRPKEFMAEQPSGEPVTI